MRRWLGLRRMAMLQAALAALFFGAGVAKLSGMPAVVAFFDAAGIGRWCRYAVGAAEILGALLLLTPRLSGVGALLLCGIMVGAVVTEGVIVGTSPLVPFAVLMVLALVAWLRRSDTAGSVARVRSVLARRRAVGRRKYTHF